MPGVGYGSDNDLTKDTHPSPSSHRVYFVNILQINDHVLKKTDCIYLLEVLITGEEPAFHMVSHRHVGCDVEHFVVLVHTVFIGCETRAVEICAIAVTAVLHFKSVNQSTCWNQEIINLTLTLTHWGLVMSYCAIEYATAVSITGTSIPEPL